MTARCSSATTPASASGRCVPAQRPPGPTTRQAFVQVASNPVDLEIGSNGDLYYADLEGGNIRRSASRATRTTARRRRSRPPTRVGQHVPMGRTSAARAPPIPTRATCSPMPGTSTATGSSTTRPAPRRPTPTRPPATTTVRLRVTDTSGAFDEDTLTINAASGTPSPTSTLRRRGRLGREPDDQLHRLRDRPRAGDPARFGARLAADHQPLHRARRTATSIASRPSTTRQRFVRRAGPRVPVTLELG